MSYNRINKLTYYKKVAEIVQKHYIPGVTTYVGIWRKYVNPVYPMCYDTFMKIIGIPGLSGKDQEKSKREE